MSQTTFIICETHRILDYFPVYYDTGRGFLVSNPGICQGDCTFTPQKHTGQYVCIQQIAVASGGECGHGRSKGALGGLACRMRSSSANASSTSSSAHTPISWRHEVEGAFPSG